MIPKLCHWSYMGVQRPSYINKYNFFVSFTFLKTDTSLCEFAFFKKIIIWLLYFGFGPKTASKLRNYVKKGEVIDILQAVFCFNVFWHTSVVQQVLYFFPLETRELILCVQFIVVYLLLKFLFFLDLDFTIESALDSSQFSMLFSPMRLPFDI